MLGIGLAFALASSGPPGSLPPTAQESAYAKAQHWNPPLPRDYVQYFPVDYPRAYQRWRALVPADLKGAGWATRLDGVGGFAVKVTIAGQPMTLLSACLAHNCGSDQAFILVSRDQTRVVGLIKSTPPRDGAPTKTLVLGSPSPAERACLNQGIVNPGEQNKACG